jgi:hypothetical protein
VVLVTIPSGLLNGLPDEDQRAISAIVGKPVRFPRYDDIARVELMILVPVLVYDSNIANLGARPLV